MADTEKNLRESPVSPGELAELLIPWYRENARDLPWRHDPSPYQVWVSEIMLQQTRVEAVKPYYYRFIRELPDIKALASCPEDRLLKLWEGLGYYSRVRNMQKAARVICEQFQEELPGDYGMLCALPGIGPYTAGAVASIAFGLPFPAVDGNVLRVMSRIFADESDIADQKVKKQWEGYLKAEMPEKEPGLFNQALMELGAVVCLPNGEPACAVCPVRRICLASKNHAWKKYPVKKAGKKRRTEQRTVFIIRQGDEVALRKRPARGLLAGLYEFPNETGYFSEKEAWQQVRDYGFFPLYIEPLPPARHVFSHVEWEMQGYLVHVGLTAYSEVYSDEIPEREQETVPGEETGEVRLAAVSRIEKDYSIPSAFSAYLNYAMGQEPSGLRGQET